MRIKELAAQLSDAQSVAVREGLRSRGVATTAAGRSLVVSVPRDRVATVLALLADADAADITCTPARLEDLFLRHYEVAAR